MHNYAKYAAHKTTILRTTYIRVITSDNEINALEGGLTRVTLSYQQHSSQNAENEKLLHLR